MDEFQELGFELNLDFKEDLADEAIDAFLDAFLKEAMEANGLGYVGGDDYGLVCLQKRGSVSEEQRAAVEAWLKARPELTSVEVSPLMDVWYPEKADQSGRLMVRNRQPFRAPVFLCLSVGLIVPTLRVGMPLGTLRVQ
nr:hypothetical protein GCM10020185_06660 [Pseudomonas brassicacearum subsp. brassicacearum]